MTDANSSLFSTRFDDSRITKRERLRNTEAEYSLQHTVQSVTAQDDENTQRRDDERVYRDFCFYGAVTSHNERIIAWNKLTCIAAFELPMMSSILLSTNHA